MDHATPIRLLVILSADVVGESPNDEIRIERIAPVYYMFKDVEADVVLATPTGGYAALAPDLRQFPSEEPCVQRFLSDRDARDDLADTLSLDQIVIDDFDAAFCIGFSGSIWGADDLGVAPVIRAFLGDMKPVAIIPGRGLDIAADGAGSGLLVVGDSGQSAALAAYALLNVIELRRQFATTA
ncbi:putative intracellular protease/amidase [Sinorhizobium fredii]|uniref:transporter n=1 Tax=Rhizobium fredii TaxID=380 RepID=UPI0035187667